MSYRERIKHHKRDLDDAFVDNATEIVARVVQSLPYKSSEALVNSTITFRDGLAAIVREDRGLARFIAEFAANSPGQELAAAVSRRDSVLLRNLASFWSVLSGVAVESRANNDVILALDHHVEWATAAFLASSRHQVEVLCRAVKRCARMAADRARERGGRVAVLECPVGNSLPTALVKLCLADAGAPSIALTVSLNRNDTKRAGITREALIAQCLEDCALESRDVLVYIDEWITGTAFKKIAERLVEHVGGATLVPVGLLKWDANTTGAYQRICDFHDAIAEPLGVTGGALRFAFTRLQNGPEPLPPFLWAESDRLAGYRKMQLWGSLVSLMREAISLLLRDEEELYRAFILVIHDMADEPMFDDAALREAMTEFQPFRAAFASSAAAFERLLPELAAVELRSNRGESHTVEEDVAKASEEVERIVLGSDAGFAAFVAVLHHTQTGGIDVADQYFYKGHVPIVETLGPGYDSFNRHAMSVLTRALVRGT